MTPYTVITLVTFLLVVKTIVSTIGKLTLHNVAWLLYIRTARGSHVALHEKKQELASVNKEKKAISAQDEYAKWTKLNRRADKLSAEVNQLQLAVNVERAGVNKMVDRLFMVVITLPIMYFRVFHRKTTLFFLPANVLPHHLEWVLALPFGIVGAIGMSVWMFCVGHVISSLIFLVSFPLKPAVAMPEKKSKIEEVVDTDLAEKQ